MPQVTLSLGGRGYVVGCREGEEPRVEHLGRMIEERWTAASKAGGSPERTFLFLALMLADELDEEINRPLPDNLVSEEELEKIADRLAELADTLERTSPSA